MKRTNHVVQAKGLIFFVLAICSIFAIAGSASAYTAEVTFYYGDITLPSSIVTLAQPGSWNLNACPLTITYTQDLSGAPNVAYTGNYDQMGIVGLFGSGSGSRMCGFLADWNNPGALFPSFPDVPDSQDIDDKFNMQRFPNPGFYDERHYDVDCTTGEVKTEIGQPDAWSNYGIWFDRDGVDPWQANMWGMVDGGTYNTNGIYEVEVVYDKSSNYPTFKGIACAMFFPNLVNDDAPDGYGIPTGFKSISEGGYQYYPYGISFDTDETKMGDMVVYVQGSSGPGTIKILDLTVTGCLNLDEGMATGGGWFIPEWNNQVGLLNPDYKATFGFVAKQKWGTSSGQLEFQYHGDGLLLKSTSYDWVAVSSTQAMFEGLGTINGIGEYKFRVRAVDGDKLGTGIDRFEIRIWTDGSDSFEMPTYRAEGDLGGGQIVVHKK